MDSLTKADIHFDKVINSLNQESVQSLFYSSIIKIQLSDTVNACRLLAKAVKKNHKGSISIYKNYCKN